jgi:beta-1,4-N-acetylglucosaminyltransferase
MLFVTVGMHTQGFERLIRKMDEIAGQINEEIIMQIGSTNFIPKNAKYFRFVKDDKMIIQYFKDARIIVSHAGAGTLLDALFLNKPVIVVPRLKRFHEHIDDQQLELAEALFSQGKIISVYNIDDLEILIDNSSSFASINPAGNHDLADYLKKVIGSSSK